MMLVPIRQLPVHIKPGAPSFPIQCSGLQKLPPAPPHLIVTPLPHPLSNTPHSHFTVTTHPHLTVTPHAHLIVSPHFHLTITPHPHLTVTRHPHPLSNNSPSPRTHSLMHQFALSEDCTHITVTPHPHNILHIFTLTSQ